MPNEKPILFSAEMIRAILASTKSQTRRVVKPQPVLHRTYDASCPSPVSGHEMVGPWCHFLGEAERLPGKAIGRPQFTVKCPYGTVGDRLWVKENFYADNRESLKHDRNPAVIYAATQETGKYKLDADVHRCKHLDGTLATRAESERNLTGHRFQKLKPSIHMPRWASRLTLEITGVRVERLQDISEEDAIAEGIGYDGSVYPPRLYNYTKKAWQAGGWPSVAYSQLWDQINGQTFPWSSNPFVWVVSFRRVEQPAPALNATAAAL